MRLVNVNSKVFSYINEVFCNKGQNLNIPILRKPPAENGRIQAVLASRDCTESRDRAVKAPSTPTLAVHICAFPASHLDSNRFTVLKNKIGVLGSQL